MAPSVLPQESASFRFVGGEPHALSPKHQLYLPERERVAIFLGQLLLLLRRAQAGLPIDKRSIANIVRVAGIWP